MLDALRHDDDHALPVWQNSQRMFGKRTKEPLSSKLNTARPVSNGYSKRMRASGGNPGITFSQQMGS
jgi:hypothetical protein